MVDLVGSKGETITGLEKTLFYIHVWLGTGKGLVLEVWYSTNQKVFDGHPRALNAIL